MSGRDELGVLLDRFNKKTGARLSAVITRSGSPLAAAVPGDVLADHVATMAATLLGALEILFASLPASLPEQVFISTEMGAVAAVALTPTVFFVALSPGSTKALEAPAREAAAAAKALLPRGR